jgi:signal transduction histidine kinase
VRAKPAQAQSAPPVPVDTLVPLECVVCTEELDSRPSPPPDYETENRALISLTQALSESPRTILQALTDKMLEVLKVGSTGISLLTTDDGGKRFYWPAISGVWKSHIGEGTPREFSPCGTVLDRDAPLLFKQLARHYTYFQQVAPPLEEVLLVPFCVGGKVVGTIWAVAHDHLRKFNAEDLRQLESLGSFASTAYQAVTLSDALEQQHKMLSQNQNQLSKNLDELRKANVVARESRRAALNLMEDAVISQRATEALHSKVRESEERYRSLFSSAPIAVFVCDRDGIIQQYNQRAVELWGREPLCNVEQYCGSVKLWLPDGAVLPHAQSPIVEVLKNGGVIRNVEMSIERPDGSRLPVLVNFAPLKNAQGGLTGAIASFVDITERKQAEEVLRLAQARLTTHADELERLVAERTAELTATNQQLEAFVYSIAHDLRAPLRSMQGFSVMLVEEAAGTLSEAGRDFANRINNSARMMDALLIDLLDFSRISQQRIMLSSVNLATVVESVLSRLQKEIQESNAHVENSGPWPNVLAHEPTLAQVLFNLTSNALTFVAPGVSPVVRLWTEEKGQFIRVWIEDNGIGIAPDHRGQIFRLFTRLHGEKYSGTGIGLAIVQKGVERMGGGVGLESVLDQGSRFWFELAKP